MQSNGQLLLKLDNQVLPLKSNSIINALDILFKCFDVFNVIYPKPANAFYTFLELIYKFAATNASPAILELENRIVSNNFN